MPIDRYFSYNIGLFVQDLQKKKFALASRPKEEQQDPTMPVCPPKLLNRLTGNFDTHRKGRKTTLEKSRTCSVEIAALELLGKNSPYTYNGKNPLGCGARFP